MNPLKYLLSFFKPVDSKMVVTADEQVYEVQPEKLPQLTFVVYRPWKDAKYYFVGHSVDETEDGIRTLFRFKDPVSNKEFLLSEELTNILLYRE